MLETLRIQNFKSWQDTGDMQFGSLTGFFGTNSSGKSSILQFLLMLKQTGGVVGTGRAYCIQVMTNHMLIWVRPTTFCTCTKYPVKSAFLLPGMMTTNFPK